MRSSLYEVMVVEDDVFACERMVRMVNETEDFRVVDTATSLQQARQALQARNPDILLVDLQLPDGRGEMLIRECCENSPDIAILVVSVFGDEDTVIDAIEAGARGYILKTDDLQTIEHVLTQLQQGGSPISAQIARHLVQRFQNPSVGAVSERTLLSERESQVLSYASRGYSYPEIAELLDVSASTVATYTKRIYFKLSVHSRSEAVFEAMRLGIVDKPDS